MSEQEIVWKQRQLTGLAPGSLVQQGAEPQLLIGLPDKRFARTTPGTRYENLPVEAPLLGVGEVAKRAARTLAFRMVERGWSAAQALSNFTIYTGCDPEFFMVDAKGKVLPAFKYLPSK